MGIGLGGNFENRCAVEIGWLAGRFKRPNQRAAQGSRKTIPNAGSCGVLERETRALGNPDQADSLGRNPGRDCFLHQRFDGAERLCDGRCVVLPWSEKRFRILCAVRRSWREEREFRCVGVDSGGRHVRRRKQRRGETGVAYCNQPRSDAPAMLSEIMIVSATWSVISPGLILKSVRLI
jgi:hypothetical protein